MKFEYFRDEERGHFTVTECMKRYWAASLKTVEIFDRICEKHSLRYWADCGTLLGAYRHRGFIPWDDDLDLGMPRKDYNRFLEIAGDELPDGYYVSTFDSKNHRYNGITVIINHRGTLYTPEILGTYYNCPFPVGFDLYPYDECPSDADDLAGWRLDYLKELTAIHYMRDELDSKGSTDYSPLIRKEMTAEAVAARYMGTGSDDIARFIFYAIHNTKPCLKRQWYETLVDMPFETGTIPVPLYTEAVLLGMFGPDYVRPINAASAHDYPLYKRDIIEMIKTLGRGGIRLSDLPPMLQYINREAALRGITAEVDIR